MKLNYDKKSNDLTYFVRQGIRNGKKITTKNILRWQTLLELTSKLGTFDKLDTYYEKPDFSYQHIHRFMVTLIYQRII